MSLDEDDILEVAAIFVIVETGSFECQNILPWQLRMQLTADPEETKEMAVAAAKVLVTLWAGLMSLGFLQFVD